MQFESLGFKLRGFSTEMQRISQRLTQRIKELAECYEFTFSELSHEVESWEKKLIGHLEKMG